MRTEKIMSHLIGKTYKEVLNAISTEEDFGDCCGYANVGVLDNLKDKCNAETAVLFDVIKIDYDESDEDRVVVNFIFDLGDENGLILGYEMSAGSGSGCSYGAFCTLKYNNEEVASASW